MNKRERIYIVPTAYGLMYGFGIFVSLIGGAIYNNNLAFMLCFFLVALFLIGMVQTHNNIKKLNLEKIHFFLSPSEGDGQGVVWLKSNNSEGHSQIRVQCSDNDDEIDFFVDEIYKKSLHQYYFTFKTGSWGKKRVKKFRLSSRYPFGLFYTWRTYQVPTEYHIYPRPSGDGEIETFEKDGPEQGLNRQQSGYDFSEHKKYQMGDSQKHIDWKAYARGRPLLTKKFNDGEHITFRIDYNEMKGGTERRLRQISKWIHDLDRDQLSYSLKLKNKKISAQHGEKHKVLCLKTLASFRELK